jgi:hypothetical protein
VQGTAVSIQAQLYFAVDEFGYMLRGGVFLLKPGQSIEVVVVELVNHLFDYLFQHFEIDSHPAGVEFCRPNGNLYLPIVAVLFLAVAGVITKMVRTGKMGFNENIVHPDLLHMTRWAAPLVAADR